MPGTGCSAHICLTRVPYRHRWRSSQQAFEAHTVSTANEANQVKVEPGAEGMDRAAGEISYMAVADFVTMQDHHEGCVPPIQTCTEHVHDSANVNLKPSSQ